MRLVCISDTHNSLDRINIPDGDVLIHAGDLTMMGSVVETTQELIKLARLPHKTKILVAGNRDFLPEREPALFAAMARDAGVIYLQDSCHVVDVSASSAHPGRLSCAGGLSTTRAHKLSNGGRIYHM